MMKTTDIWFASYLKYKGYEVVDYEVLSRGKGRYEFDITDKEWKKLKLEFAKSETNSIKSQHLGLKDMLF